MTQIPIPLTVEVSAAAATPKVTSASLYPSLLASVDAMAEPALWVLMEATVYSLRQRDTLTRSIKECGTVECFGDRSVIEVKVNSKLSAVNVNFNAFLILPQKFCQ